MNDLKAMRTFVEVANRGSFVGAARALGVSTSSVSRLVGDLEEWLGVSVLYRTPRNVQLTEFGEHYLERCQQIVAATDDLREDARALTGRPRGTLNVAAARQPARSRLVPLLPEFHAQYPDVRIHLHLKNEHVNLVGSGMDVAVRVGPLADSPLIARRCGDVALKLTASPGFLAENGAPTSLDALPAYPCLVDTIPTFGRRWPIGRRLNVSGPIMANDGEIIRDMTLAGLGLSLLPDFFVDEDIAAGRLLDLFADEIDERLGLYVIYPAVSKNSAAARAFIDFLLARLPSPP